MATIHDKDVLIYCISQLVAKMNRGEAISRVVRLHAYDLLVATNRQTSGEGYRLLADALTGLKASRYLPRRASPTAGTIDSQSVKTTESGGISDYDAGKKLKGRKRDIVTDTPGVLLFVLVHAADIQDRDGAVDLVKAIRHRFPRLRHPRP